MAQVEKLPRVREESFRTLANQAPIMIWQADINGNATFYNATWMAFTGHSNEDGKGLRWISAVHPDDRARALEIWKRAFVEHLPYHSEFRLRRVDGVYVPRCGFSGFSLYRPQWNTPGFHWHSDGYFRTKRVGAPA